MPVLPGRARGAPGPTTSGTFANRWPALPGGRHEVVLHSPDHDASFPALGDEQAARVIELWSARTAALGARDDVAYVFVFENRGRAIGATIDHPHSQIMAFGAIPPIPEPSCPAGNCGLLPRTRRRPAGHPPLRLAGGRAVGALVAVRAAASPRTATSPTCPPRARNCGPASARCWWTA